MQEWLGEFWSALPDVVQALYWFGDPWGLGRGWVGALVTLLWIGPLLLLPLYLAKIFYGKREWVSATMGVLAGGTFLWWIAGVIPHVWIQFSESNRNILAGQVIPESATLPNSDWPFANLYSVIVEGLVGGLMVASIVVALWAVLRMQKTYGKTLAPGETKPEAGGYK